MFLDKYIIYARESFCDIKKIRSSYIRKYIFGFLSRKKRLEIVKYYNIIKNKLVLIYYVINFIIVLK